MEARPKTQSSRKGKKAWRKNIVVDDINLALEAKREKEILHGTEEDVEGEFVIDTEGSSKLKRPVAVLKTVEILTNKSKVPALRPKMTKKKVSKSRAHKLMALAGRLLTESKVKAAVDSEGLVKGENVDLWGMEASPAEKPPPGPPTTSFTKATRMPVTLQKDPRRLLEKQRSESVVHAGKSYNPSLESWKSLIDGEISTEYEKQVKIQALESERERIQSLIDAFSDSDDNDDAQESPEEEDEEDEEDKYKLSINPRVEVKRKTRTQRNKEARHKQTLDLHKKLRELKVQLRDLSNLPKIQQEVEKKAKVHKVQKPKPSMGKREPLFTPIEVKLADELTNNLRRVKPEGNPFYEHMNKLHMAGKVEANYPTKNKKERKPRIVERYSHKYFEQKSPFAR